MLFNSLEFLFLFLPITLVAFFQIARRGSYQLASLWLVLASLIFYSWGNPAYLVLLISSILFNYFVGSSLNQQSLIGLNKKLLLILGITANLAMLCYFKYANFFISTANELLSTNFNLNKIILPLGISFFTFQQIAYLVDTYRGETKQSNFLQYNLFVTFFPQLIAGPISLHKNLMPQFANQSIYRFNHKDMAIGLTVFLLGLSKKVLLADSVAVYANPIFNAAAEGVQLTFLEAWIGAIAYSLQLYFDFSGYCDMAIGAARMFGIELPLNFNSPYKAVNIIDFWRRWHITLSNFLRDYLYIPLGGNRQGGFRRNVNLMITMLLGGLWHGAGWNFIFWGGLHGLYLIINHQWRSFRKFLGHDLKKSHWWSRGFSCLVTFIAVVVGWVFFRAESMYAAIAMLKAMSGVNGFSLAVSVVAPAKKLLISLLLFVWFAPNTQQWVTQQTTTFTHSIADTSSRESKQLWQKLLWQSSTAFGLFLGLLAFIAVKTLLNASQSEFLYFKF